MASANKNKCRYLQRVRDSDLGLFHSYPKCMVLPCWMYTIINWCTNVCWMYIFINWCTKLKLPREPKRAHNEFVFYITSLFNHTHSYKNRSSRLTFVYTSSKIDILQLYMCAFAGHHIRPLQRLLDVGHCALNMVPGVHIWRDLSKKIYMLQWECGGCRENFEPTKRGKSSISFKLDQVHY